MVIADIDGPAAKDVVGGLARPGLAVVGDHSNPEDAERMVQSTVEQFGGLDILCNNAGITHRGTVITTSVEDWRRVLDIDLTGPFLLSKSAVPAMIERGGGAIVNTSSGVAIKAQANKLAYGVAKAGLIQLTRQMASDHGNENVRVNCICPGPVGTPLFYTANSPEVQEQAKRSRPLQRVGTPEEMADAVLFLASDQSSYITGHVLIVDGGGVLG